jgi:hypothetical protein
LLAAIVYGESSTADVFEEMAALANVMVRQSKARGYNAFPHSHQRKNHSPTLLLMEINVLNQQ